MQNTNTRNRPINAAKANWLRTGLTKAAALVAALALGSTALPAQAQKTQVIAPTQVFDANIGRYVGNCYQSAATAPASSRTSGTFNSTYGVAFTPRDSMKVLVIFAGFVESYNSNNAPTSCSDYMDPQWPQVPPGSPLGTPAGTTLPSNLSSYCYTSQSQFSPTATDQTISNYFYQMSRTSAKPLKLTFGYFPTRINIPASGRSYGDIVGYETDVLNTIKNRYQNFDMSPYDRRTNNPNGSFDNSTTGPDGQLDYVIICFRGGCSAGLPSSTGIAGVPTVVFPATGTHRAYTVTTGHGMVGMTLDRNIVLHEMAHTVYNSPHLFGANGTTGNYFYCTPGWGMMQSQMTFYASNAWERWYLGWTELMTGNGQGGTTSSDIQSAASLTATNGIYTLRDYTTTGDVVRIKLPNTSQYVWLENHAKTGPSDQRLWQTAGDGLPFLPSPSGLMAMVEDMGDRSTVLGPGTGINGLQAVSAEGNFDYNPGTLSNWNRHLWDNLFYDMNGFNGSATPNPNPTGGHNQSTNFRWDRNGDGQIDYDAYAGNDDKTTGNEIVLNARVNGAFTDGLLGPALGTKTVGFRYSLDSNPMLIPHQTFNPSTQHLSEIPLNGLSIQITGYNSSTGDITIQVRYDNIDVYRSTRWTGELRTYPVTNTTMPGASVYIHAGIRLTLDRSATPQRSTLSSRGDFVNDTKLTVSTGTQLNLASCGNLDLTGAGTTLYVENGASVYVSGCAQLTAYAGTTISVNNLTDLMGNGGNPTIVWKPGSTRIVRSTGQVTTF